MSETLSRLKDAIAAFEATQRKFRRHGAQDTEPDGYFQWTLVRASKGKLTTVSDDADKWELYEGRGAAQAAVALAKAAQVAVDIVRATPLGESEQVLAYLRTYCWRVSW
jgi:hypothetical protein